MCIAPIYRYANVKAAIVCQTKPKSTGLYGGGSRLASGYGQTWNNKFESFAVGYQSKFCAYKDGPLVFEWLCHWSCMSSRLQLALMALVCSELILVGLVLLYMYLHSQIWLNKYLSDTLLVSVCKHVSVANLWLFLFYDTFNWVRTWLHTLEKICPDDYV